VYCRQVVETPTTLSMLFLCPVFVTWSRIVTYHYVSSTMVWYLSQIKIMQYQNGTPYTSEFTLTTLKSNSETCNTINMPDVGPQYADGKEPDGVVFQMGSCRVSSVLFASDKLRRQAQDMGLHQLVNMYSTQQRRNLLNVPIA